jgi:hypothetical protein
MLVSFTFPQVGKQLVDAAPEPLRVMVAGELVAVLTTETLPVTLPATVGANSTLNVVLCPAVRVTGRSSPLELKPTPETLI